MPVEQPVPQPPARIGSASDCNGKKGVTYIVAGYPSSRARLGIGARWELARHSATPSLDSCDFTGDSEPAILYLDAVRAMLRVRAEISLQNFGLSFGSDWVEPEAAKA